MAEAAHILIVQSTAVLALLLGIVSLWFAGQSYLHFSPGSVKKAVGLITLTLLITVPALLFMVIYHVWDIEITQDLWHVFIGLSLIAGAVASVYLVRVSTMFKLK